MTTPQEAQALQRQIAQGELDAATARQHIQAALAEVQAEEDRLRAEAARLAAARRNIDPRVIQQQTGVTASAAERIARQRAQQYQHAQDALDPQLRAVERARQTLRESDRISSRAQNVDEGTREAVRRQASQARSAEQSARTEAARERSRAADKARASRAVPKSVFQTTTASVPGTTAAAGQTPTYLSSRKEEALQRSPLTGRTVLIQEGKGAKDASELFQRLGAPEREVTVSEFGRQTTEGIGQEVRKRLRRGIIHVDVPLDEKTELARRSTITKTTVTVENAATAKFAGLPGPGTFQIIEETREDFPEKSTLERAAPRVATGIQFLKEADQRLNQDAKALARQPAALLAYPPLTAVLAAEKIGEAAQPVGQFLVQISKTNQERIDASQQNRILTAPARASQAATRFLGGAIIEEGRRLEESPVTAGAGDALIIGGAFGAATGGLRAVKASSTLGKAGRAGIAVKKAAGIAITIEKAGGATLGAVFLAQTGRELIRAETPEARGALVAGAATELAAFGLGAKLGSSAASKGIEAVQQANPIGKKGAVRFSKRPSSQQKRSLRQTPNIRQTAHGVEVRLRGKNVRQEFAKEFRVEIQQGGILGRQTIKPLRTDVPGLKGTGTPPKFLRINSANLQARIPNRASYPPRTFQPKAAPTAKPPKIVSSGGRATGGLIQQGATPFSRQVFTTSPRRQFIPARQPTTQGTSQLATQARQVAAQRSFTGGNPQKGVAPSRFEGLGHLSRRQQTAFLKQVSYEAQVNPQAVQAYADLRGVTLSPKGFRSAAIKEQLYGKLQASLTRSRAAQLPIYGELPPNVVTIIKPLGASQFGASLKAAPVQAPSLSSTQATRQIEAQATAAVIKPAQIQAESTNHIFVQDQAQNQAQIQIQGTSQRQSQQTVQAFQPATDTFPKGLTDFSEGTPPPSNIPPPPFTPPRPPPPTGRGASENVPPELFKPLRLFPSSTKNDRQANRGYIVEIRQGGLWRQITTQPVSFSRAVELGKKSTFDTLRASFTIKEAKTGRKALYEEIARFLPPGIFRPSKREAGVVIQKREKRLSSLGERSEIKNARPFTLKTKSPFRR